MVHISAKEYQEMLRRESAKKKPKHHNKFVYVYEDGMVSDVKTLTSHGAIVQRYDSKKEFARHRELKILERIGRIKDLRWQVPMLIQEGFTDQNGKKVRPIFYNADFSYTENGKEIVEGVKGVDKKTGRPQTTEAFRLKWKLLAAKYPGKEFRIY